jgi:hypothetical protein
VVAPRNGLKERADRVVGYGLYAEGIGVACFAEGRMGYHEWAHRHVWQTLLRFIKVVRIHTLDFVGCFWRDRHAVVDHMVG